MDDIAKAWLWKLKREYKDDGAWQPKKGCFFYLWGCEMNRIILVLVVIGLCLMGTSAFGQGIDENTVLMLHLNGEDGSTYTVDDSNSNHSITAYGNAQLSTAEKKFGSSSLRLGGDNGYLSLPDSDDWHFGTGDFTIDFWYLRSDITANVQYVFDMGNGRDTDGLAINFYSTITVVYVYLNGAIGLEFASLPAWDTSWHHFALTRSGNIFRLFIDGTQYGGDKTSTADIQVTTASFRIGWFKYETGANSYNGYIDEFRVSKGIARWTSDFTPPTSEYDTVPNELPIAGAGEDITANVGDNLTLNGSSSYDPDGNIVSWVWRSLSDPQRPVIGEGEHATTKAHGYVEELVELTVTDNRGGSATDTMSILNRKIEEIELTPGPTGPQGMQGPQGEAGPQGIQGEPGIIPAEVAAMQAEIAYLKKQSADNRYLLEQLPQLQKKIAELEAQVQ